MTATLTALADALIDEPVFSALKGHVIATTGLTYYDSRDAELAQHVRQRLIELGLSSCDAYLDLLQSEVGGEAELDALIARLTIGETYFFRHREMFEALETAILPQLIERNSKCRRLRIWSAGCSVGAEAYSIAILLQRRFGHLLRGWDISILGTDINREFLAKAISGKFDEWAFRSTPDWLREEYFTPVGQAWQIAPQLSAAVSFQYHNLARHCYPALVHNLYAFDLILCRNVMIYCNQEIIRRIAAGCWESLVDGGWLLVGHAEADPDVFRQFRRVTTCGAILYQKDGTAAEAAAASGLVDLRPTAENRDGLSASRGRIELPARVGHRNYACASHTRGKVIRQNKTPQIDDDLEEVRFLTDQGELETAAARCRNILSTDRMNPTVNFFLALIVEQLGLHDEAQHRLRQTIYLNRHDALAHYYLGIVLLKSGQQDRARKSFANVLRLLATKPRDQLLPPTDDMTVADLTELARIHLDTKAKA